MRITSPFRKNPIIAAAGIKKAGRMFLLPSFSFSAASYERTATAWLMTYAYR